ncbi:MAG: hypothetical protein JSW41_01950 [Candidatus Aenigmatarchaeota archaeon]|nr:MAG: hypothetical protein JSW41_01950 [Candidatus Aenigmarchaeota archaeon]
MAKKDLQEKYAELYGEAPDDTLTVKELEAAIAEKEPAPAEEASPADSKSQGRVRRGWV